MVAPMDVLFLSYIYMFYDDIPYKMKIWREINLANQCLIQDWRIQYWRMGVSDFLQNCWDRRYTVYSGFSVTTKV